MKRLFTIITLLVSSFFLFTTNEVKAETYEYLVNESDFDLINDDFYAVRDYALNYVEENNGYYLIYYSKSYSQYRVVLSPKLSSTTLSYKSSLISLTFNANPSDNRTGTIYKYENNEFVNNGSFGSISLELWFNENVIPMNSYLDSNLDFFYTDTSNEIKINYNDFSYVVNSTNSLPSLYQIYLDTQSTPVDKYEEDKIVITSFYTMVSEKFTLLTNLFMQDYVFVLILTIIILIFLLELIFRRNL